MRPLLALILIGLVTPPTNAHAALSLRWSSGALNLAPRDAAPCTLGVHGQPSLPARWRLVWRSDRPIEMLRPNPDARVPGYTRACAFEEPMGLADQISNLYGTQHCGETPTGDSVA